MNTVYVLMLITATGAIEAPNNFNTLAECERALNRIQSQQQKAYCVSKKPVDMQKELTTFIALFKHMMREIENANK